MFSFADLAAKGRELRVSLLARGASYESKPLRLQSFGSDVRKAEEVEGLRSRTPIQVGILSGKPSETDHARLLGVQLEAEPCESLGEHPLHLSRIAFQLEGDHEVVDVAHDANFAACLRLPPLVDPEIDDVVQVHVRK
jgi:hypothetical protein